MREHGVPIASILSKNLEHPIVPVLPNVAILLFVIQNLARDTEPIREPTHLSPMAIVVRCAVGFCDRRTAEFGQQIDRRRHHSIPANIHASRR